MALKTDRIGRGRMAAMAVGVLAVGAALGVGVSQRLADPTAVAVVDIDRVSNGLEEFKDRVADIQQQTSERQAELQRIADRIEEINLELEALTPEQSDRRIQLLIDGQVQQSDLQTKTQLYAQEQELKQADLVRSLYEKITEAAGRVADRDGWDIVLFDDRSISLNDPSAQNFAATIELMKSKKVLHASEVSDLTPSVLAMMNNEYAAGE